MSLELQAWVGFVASFCLTLAVILYLCWKARGEL